MTEHPPSLIQDYTLEQVATALGMSTRWIRERIREGKEGKGEVVEHVRRGHKILFTAEQVEKLRLRGTVAPPVEQSITTGKKKSA